MLPTLPIFLLIKKLMLISSKALNLSKENLVLMEKFHQLCGFWATNVGEQCTMSNKLRFF